MVLPLEMVVAGGGVVVETGDGVVVEVEVEATIINNHFNDTFALFPDSLVTSVVTVTSPVTTAKNPLAAPNELVCSLTMMVVPVKGPGMEPQ